MANCEIDNVGPVRVPRQYFTHKRETLFGISKVFSSGHFRPKYTVLREVLEDRAVWNTCYPHDNLISE